MKTKHLTIRISEEEKRRLDELAAHARRGISDYIRLLINDEYDSLVGNNEG